MSQNHCLPFCGLAPFLLMRPYDEILIKEEYILTGARRKLRPQRGCQNSFPSDCAALLQSTGVEFILLHTLLGYPWPLGAGE